MQTLLNMSQWLICFFLLMKTFIEMRTLICDQDMFLISKGVRIICMGFTVLHASMYCIMCMHGRMYSPYSMVSK